MLRGLYQATSAMVIAKTKQEIISGNLANVETPGYKKQTISDEVFSSAMLMAQLGLSTTALGGSTVKSAISEPTIDHSQGQLVHSDSPFHLALGGSGFFAVQTEDGVRYTRAGDFRLDASGNLVDSHGGFLLNRAWQPIRVMGQDFRVDSQGAMFVDDRPVGFVQVVSFANPESLVKDRNGQFKDDGGVTTASNARVMQNMLERSNVEIGQELIDMMLVSRIFDSAQRIVSTYDQLLEKAKDIGSVR